jgi:hypothetical protein
MRPHIFTVSSAVVLSMALGFSTLHAESVQLPSCRIPTSVPNTPLAIRELALNAKDMHLESLQELIDLRIRTEGDFIEQLNIVTKQQVQLGLITEGEAKMLMELYNVMVSDQIPVS